MHSPVTNSRTKGPLSISDVGPRFGSTKLAACAPKIRVFCECVGVCALRVAPTLAVLSALLLILIAARPAQAQTEKVLYNFTGGSDGSNPVAGLTSDGAGNLYGTTKYGGLACTESQYGCGTVFELSPNGNGGWNETVLYSFTGGADGANPYNVHLIFDSAGNLYGTTQWGGEGECYFGFTGCGVVFELSPIGASWTETVLYSFANDGNGSNPESGLIFDPAGNLYGTSSYSVFELSPSHSGWTEQVIYNTYTSGAGLTMDAAGNIYGTTNESHRGPTVFELSPNGSGGWNSKIIYKLPPGDPSLSTLVFDQSGNLYGTTVRGRYGYGKLYKLSPEEYGEWTYKTLHSFNESDPNPYGIVFDADGNIYGTTYSGGAGGGTVYKLVAPVGTGKYKEKTLWTFNGTDGSSPYYGSLIWDSAGNLYGTTQYGGSGGTGCGGPGCGVVFELTPSAVAVKTTTTLSSAPNPSTYGEAVTFTAVVTSSRGAPPDGETITFEHGKTLLGTGSLSGGLASFTTSTLKVGTTSVMAVYGGDSNFLGSKSNIVKQVVEKAK